MEELWLIHCSVSLKGPSTGRVWNMVGSQSLNWLMKNKRQWKQSKPEDSGHQELFLVIKVFWSWWHWSPNIHLDQFSFWAWLSGAERGWQLSRAGCGSQRAGYEKAGLMTVPFLILLRHQCNSLIQSDTDLQL